MTAAVVSGTLIAALIIACAVLIERQRRLKKDVRNLTEQIEDFLNNDKMTPFSLYDNDFAKLQNSVSDLEELVKLEQNKLAAESRKNTEFISDISHQLKTPIAAIKLYCEMDNEMKPSTHNTKELELISKMESLVYQLLRLEKIKTGDIYCEDYKCCDLSALIKGIISDFKPFYPNKTFSVIGESKMRCSINWLGEAVSNVIKNACEHTADDGCIKVEISDTGHASIIKISDNGGGADEDDLKNIFIRFYKSKESSEKSTGIGLAIAKAVVERHHGVISAENQGDGLVLSICLPHIEANEII